MAEKTSPPRVRVRIVRAADAAALVPLFEAFYGAFFGGRVTEPAVSGRLRQAAAHEIVIVADADEAQAAYRELLADPGEAESMGARARERVLDEHTYRHRARRLLEMPTEGDTR